MGKKQPFDVLAQSINRRLLLCLIIAIPVLKAHTQSMDFVGRGVQYPKIDSLNSKDPVFRQLEESVEMFYRAFNRGERVPEVLLFLYTMREGDDLYSISARTNLGFAAIATLNGLTDSTSLREGNTIIIPNTPGLYIPARFRNELDRLMILMRNPMGVDNDALSTTVGENELFYCIPGGKMNSLELAYFWGILFRFPISYGGVISSSYGVRRHPITGEQKFHSGIDIAARMGAEVVAARGGVVILTALDQDLGRYVVLQHDAGYTTVYGHLDTVSISLNQRIASGTMIGTVGSTGKSTGPHLHFEIRSEGDSTNPLKIIRGKDE